MSSTATLVSAGRRPSEPPIPDGDVCRRTRLMVLDEVYPLPAEGTVTLYKPQAVGKSDAVVWSTSQTPFLAQPATPQPAPKPGGNRAKRRRTAALKRRQ